MTAAWYLEGAYGQLLDTVTESERKRGLAGIEAGMAADERDDAIRQLLAGKVPVRVIVAASGLSRERVYQIRDRRR